MIRKGILAGFALAGLGAAALAQNQGPSTKQKPWLRPSSDTSGVRTISIASNGNGVIDEDETYNRLNTGEQTYRLVGLPDGMGILQTDDDLANGTFTLLVNHEAVAAAGVVRDHGNAGAFVSSWTIRVDDFSVVGGKDLATVSYLWDITNDDWLVFDKDNPMPEYKDNKLQDGPAKEPFPGFGRHCAGDLPPVGSYRFNDLGTDARIYLNGEEIGSPGRAFAYVVTGPEAGTVWELAWLGDYSWENALGHWYQQEKTIVIGLDDATPGNVYIHVGTKQAEGVEIVKAGLNNAVTYGIVIEGVTRTNGQSLEDRTNALGTSETGPIYSKPFTTYQFEDVVKITGADLQKKSDENFVMNWLRPEDGAWDPHDPRKFYFVTTDSFSGNSRIWQLEFSDIAQPELGGTATMLGDGSVPATFAGGIVSAGGLTDVRMMDNMVMTQFNQILIQEDVGNNPRLGRVWLYDITTDRITDVLIHDADRFLSGGSKFLTQDEESSGIVDALNILGRGWYVLNDQAHYGISGELVEGGQLLALYVPKAGGFTGDLNCDDSVDFNDIDAFVETLVGGREGYEAAYPNCIFELADTNNDDSVDFDDIDGFVSLLIK